MRSSVKTGFSFGLTSGVITTLGLMVGLQAGTHSKTAVIGGILTIAIADAFSDALGIHISQETQDKISSRQVWEATIVTFLTKLFFALTFVLPVLFLKLSQAVMVSIAWGLGLLSLFSYRLGKKRQVDSGKIILEHLGIAFLVILATHFVGDWIGGLFG